MMKRALFRALHFTRKERTGAALLCLFILVSFIVPEMLESAQAVQQGNTVDIDQAWSGSAMASSATPVEPFNFDPNEASEKDFILLGLSAKTARSIVNYRNKGGRFKRPEDFSKIYTLSDTDFERLKPFIRIDEPKIRKQRSAEHHRPALRPFDPNTAEADELCAVGFPRYLAERLVRYRKKGGVFMKVEDLKRLYGMDQELYKKIEPYVLLPPPASGDTIPERQKSVHFSKRAPEPIEINMATLEEWMSLPGIGEWRAKRIVTYREKLGGFLEPKQVGETYGVPDSVFQKVLPLLRGGGVIRQIDINRASVDELKTHPYISNKEAGRIAAYRVQNGDILDYAQMESFFAGNQHLKRLEQYLVWDNKKRAGQ